MNAELERLMDKAKAKIFTGKHSAFKGPLMCGLDFVWDSTIPTAATDSVRVFTNPDFWQRIPEKTRVEVLEHELDHVGRLHHIRRGTRDPMQWNYACDYSINNGLVHDGATFEGVNPLIDKKFEGMAEEEIYDLINGENPPPPPKGGSWGDGEPDMKPLDPKDTARAINNVVAAVQQAKLSGKPGHIPGGMEEVIDRLLKPVVPWERLLGEFFTDMSDTRANWGRPNRRYTDIYLPSWEEDEGRLTHLAFFFDVSGSVTNDMLKRFLSEVYYIRSVLQPKTLSLIQFDTQIQRVDVYTDDDPADTSLKIVGRGGTSIACVADWINKHKPTAAAIMTDMIFEPMERLKEDTPLFYINVGKAAVQPPFGKVVHVRT